MVAGEERSQLWVVLEEGSRRQMATARKGRMEGRYGAVGTLSQGGAGSAEAVTHGKGEGIVRV